MKTTLRVSPLSTIILFLMCLSFSGITYAGLPLIGSYTINSALPTGGTNFQSFNAFADSINSNGISGNVTVTVALGSGPYNEKVIFSNIQGTSASATVTLDGNGETITALTTTTDRYVIRLSNIQYFTINNLHIAWNPSSTGGFYGIHIFNTGSHITISNCQVDLSGTTSTLYGAYVASGSETSILTTGDFHSISFTGNTATGGGYGISLFGLVSNLASNILIHNNQILDFHSNGIYLRETNGAIISNNHFDKTTANVTTVNAIQMAQAANINANIFNNSIKVSQLANGTSTFRGIYLFNGTGHKVYNNVFHDIRLQTGHFTAIEIRTGSTAPEIYFNTISIDDTTAATGNFYGIKEELSNTNAVLRNNMISISRPTTGMKAAFVLGSSSAVTSAFNSNYNNIWVPNGSVAQRGTTSPITYANLLSWQGASTQDGNSLSLDPQFASLALPQPTNPALDNTGTPITWITTDILGAARGVIPDIGAYEFGSGPPNAPAAIFGDTILCAQTLGKVYFITPVSGATGYTWNVSPGATITSGQGTTSITIDFGSTNTILGVMASNSAGSSSTTFLSITVNPVPVVTLSLPFDTICSTDPALALSGGLPGSGTFSGPGVTQGVFDPATAGAGVHVISYTYENALGCTGTASDEITVVVCLNIADVNNDTEELTIFPNPFNTTTTITHNIMSGTAAIYLMDETGRMVRTYTLNGHQMTINRVGLRPGVYYLILVPENNFPLRKKLVIH